MSTLFDRGPGPRLPPALVRTPPPGCEPCDRPPSGATLDTPDHRFEVVSCHSSRDGFASITLRDLMSGAVMTLQKVPFEHDYDESFESQCLRIQAAARAIVGDMARAMSDGDPTPHGQGPAPLEQAQA